MVPGGSRVWRGGSDCRRGRSLSLQASRPAIDNTHPYVAWLLPNDIYQVAAVPRTDVDTLTRSGEGADRDESEWVQLDPSTTQRTVDLARAIVGGRTDRVEIVRAVEAWLRANVRYQLDAPLPPDQQNAVDFLLFDSHAGFCEHFAAAETILLRSLGEIKLGDVQIKSWQEYVHPETAS